MLLVTDRFALLLYLYIAANPLAPPLHSSSHFSFGFGRPLSIAVYNACTSPPPLPTPHGSHFHAFPLPLQILRQGIFRDMVPLRKAVLPSSSFLLLLPHSPNAMANAGNDVARAEVAALLAKYHADRASRIPIPVRSPSHPVHASDPFAVRDLAPKPLKSWGVEAAMDQFLGAAMAARG